MFLSFGIKDLIDILLVAVLLYYAYRLMKESRSLNIFFGVLIFIAFWLFISQIMEMRLLGTLLDRIVSVGAIALLILSSTANARRRVPERTFCPSSWPACRCRNRKLAH